jgi:hypothetical protein
MRFQCPRCEMPFHVPDDAGVTRWSCDCGESWQLETER